MATDVRYDFKRIEDAVHGTIGLSELEIAVINTASFQRLHSVRQLGLAYLVYPGAAYSRFSHCLGVCHVVGMLMTAILSRKNGNLTDVDKHEIQRHRLAGLLHDIGHYPYSHAIETAIENYYKGKNYLTDSIVDAAVTSDVAPIKADGKAAGTKRVRPPYHHEKVGEKLLKLDVELRDAIGKTGEFTAEEIGKIFNRRLPGPYANVVSSDLDADRMDYLLRTAHFTGLPYGSIDLGYIASQICLDDTGHVSLTYNAVRAADQFLLSRFLDYRQVAFHKTVAGLEWLLKDVFQALLALDSELDLTAAGVDKRIENGKWKRFNDSYVNEAIARTLDDGKFDPITAKKAAALLERRAPKLVAGIERFQPRLLKDEPNLHRLTVAAVESGVDRWAAKEAFDIARPLWHVWQNKIQLTKVGSRFTMAMAHEGEGRSDKYAENIRMTRRHGEESRPLQDVPQSLTSLLAGYDYRMIRVFVLLDKDQENKEFRLKIFDRIKSDLQDAGWTYPEYVVGTEDARKVEYEDEDLFESGEGGDGEGDETPIDPQPSTEGKTDLSSN